MQFVTGITLILETGEEIGLHSYDIGKVDVSGVMDVVHKIGDNIVQFKQADSIFIMLLPGVNCPYRPFGIGNETTIFNRLLEKNTQISRIMVQYVNGATEEFFAPEEDVQEIYLENGFLVIDVYDNWLVDQEGDIDEESTL